MKNKLLLLLLLMSTIGWTQNTVGLISYEYDQVDESYTLMHPHGQPNNYLLNNCGEIVHVWEDDVEFAGATAYLLPNGQLLKGKDRTTHLGDSIWAGGAGSMAELRSWDNELLWHFELNTDERRLHHDISPMPNGNVLMLAWEKKTKEEAIAAGRNPALITQGKLWPDYIFEVNPETDEVVWEWHVWDHLIQDFDESKANFGVVSEHPELVDVNYDTRGGIADWMHGNALDYNEDLDQVMLGVPAFNEIWIIDHSTTTTQAAGHTGGGINHGGDLLYRVGNPAAYQKGDSGEQILFFQHNAHWVNEFVEFGNPYFGQVMCFNNRVAADHSSVESFASSWNMYLGDYEQFDGAFPPFEFTHTFTHPEPTRMYSNILSSAQAMPNGNLFVAVGRTGYLFEVNPENEVVWEYIIPLRMGQPATQGDSLMVNDNLIFKAFKYPATYSAFEGRDLAAIGFIENEPDEDYCDFLITTNFPSAVETKVFPTIADTEIMLTWETMEAIEIELVDLLGRTRLKTHGYGGEERLDVSALEAGVYVVSVNGMQGVKVVVY